ncbi:MAG: aminodeoxychorismate synthase component I [Novosphingobium sp.]
MSTPFVLLDDSRSVGASDARLYRGPHEVVVARRPEEVAPALARLAELSAGGAELAGYIAYEAGLALEPKLAPLAPRRAGAAGPLLWFGAFAGWEPIPAGEVPALLAAEGGGGPPAIGPLEPQLSPGGYARGFATIREAILAGDIYQANLTFALAGPWRGDPLALYAAIRPHAAAGYSGVVFDGAHWLLSFSPELLLALRGAAITAKPMKGTRPRAANRARDAAAAAELAASTKDRAENLMIVDLIRNDLSRVAEPGSVRVEAPFAVESYPTVHQMTTTVRARLTADRTPLDLLRAMFPCGSVTGAPKIRAIELIDAVERDPRGAYCGAIGRLGPAGPDGSGEAAFNVAIRTLRLTPGDDGRGGRAVMGVGSAIVADSDALDEWREGLVKGGFVGKSAAAAFDLVETMRVEAGGGVPRLDLHLARIGASAAELGFAFDEGDPRGAIAALVANSAGPGRLRLLAARSGARALELGPVPDPLPEPAWVALLPRPVSAGDWRLRHKTTDRGFYAAARRAAAAAGADEAVLLDEAGRITEGSFTNVFVARDGVLLTPPAGLGLLPGVLRRALLDEGRAREAELRLDDLAGGFFLGNAVRGLLPARLLGA